MMSSLQLPTVPVPHAELARYIAENPGRSIVELLEPYRQFEAQLRQLYAQEPGNNVLKNEHINVFPLFTDGGKSEIKIRARNLEDEPQAEKDRYVMALPDEQRRPDGSPAVVQSLKEFQHNFNVFSESSLVDLDWSNVVASGSSVVNTLLPVPQRYGDSKRALREFYHEKFCPASDVDLFIYGLTEEQAIEKIKQVETSIRDSILTETTTVRTKNAITICSQYPTRHIQIVLRIYKNVSEILTGFDIDCSGAAYDGKQVYCTPRALQSYITQINHIDLSRRSPSYENRLSKYSHRGFEVYWPDLDRSRIDPTIFERSFQRTLGLARLLVLERLPTASSRDSYLAKRREERGRPPLNRHHFRGLAGNIKENHEDEIAEWVNEEEVSNYHTFTVPYGAKFHAKKIEKLCYTRDLLLNAEWNQPKDREVYLHRHPAFFGRFEDVMNDCCGSCPKPETEEEKAVHEEESKTYVSGNISFLQDDPGRQQIGSFNPLTEDDWTEMAYIGNTARLCQDIVDGELEHVQDWLSQEGADLNTRDHTGRTPLHLAVTSSTVDVVKCLVDHGARLVARLADGRTALHLAAERGNADIVKILMDKSTANEAEEEEKQSQKKSAKTTSASREDESMEDSVSDMEVVSDVESESDDEQQSMATGSFVKVKKDESVAPAGAVPEDKEDDPDFYDINVVAWDSPCSAMHFAIICGHEEVVRLLCQEYGADILLPVKYLNEEKQPTAAILTLVLSIKLPIDKAKSMAKTILSLGASSAQADMNGSTAFQRIVEENSTELVEVLLTLDEIGAKNSLNHLSFSGWQQMDSTLQHAIKGGDIRLVLQLLDAGAVPQIDFEMWLKAAKQSPKMDYHLRDIESNTKLFERGTEQPIITAIQSSDPAIVLELLKRGADVNTMTTQSYQVVHNKTYGYGIGKTLLDLVEDQLDRLRMYEPPAVNPPELKSGMEEVLKQYKQGSWQCAAVETAVFDAHRHNERTLEHHEKEKARIAGLEGVQEMQAAVDTAISKFEEIKQFIISSGGKTFGKLHPNSGYSRLPRQNRWQPAKEPLEFQYNFQFFGVPDVTEKRMDKYIELFEAAWSGDLDTIKALTLVSWDPENNEPPLQIAVNDGSNSPFSLAYMRGHLDVAKTILDIAQAQYVPAEKPVTRYRMQSSEDEYSEDSDISMDDDDDDEPRILGQIVDEHFTIDNVGQVSMQVKSRTKPLTMLNWSFPTLRLDNGKHRFSGGGSLLDHVIANDDREGLKYYYDLAVYYSDRDEDKDDEGSRFVAFPQSAFWSAVEMGRIGILADMIQWAGAGLPLEALIKKTGVELKEKPKYYQGLTVYGKKRKDWANAGRNVISRPKESTESPLLRTSQKGCIESVEWFLSDAPLRNYIEFGKSKAAKEDARLKHLHQSQGGFEMAVARWLSAENDLVISAAVLGPNDHSAQRLVEYLVKVYPSAIEAKGSNGRTPLWLASWLGRLDLVKVLVANGADQSTRDSSHENILHAALANDPDPEKLDVFLKTLDPDLVRDVILDRSGHNTSDGRTPLQRWLATNAKSISDKPERYVKVLRLLLEYSGGKDLDTLDARGDTPLHTLIRDQADPAMIREILNFNPKLLHRENAVGQTPADVAHDAFVRACVPKHNNRLMYSYHRHGDKSVAGVLLDRPFEESARLAKHGEPAKKPSTVQQIYDLAAEFAAAHPGKRRLVSLHEANDVARRIGETYQGQRYGWKGFGGAWGRRRRAHRGVADNLPDEEAVAAEEQAVDVLSRRMFDLRLSAWDEPKKGTGFVG
ncbi:hypothetical protein KVR01_005584 [Diaporthe batatas]|uniref:uncharacterized protein n=1 Tax=Diaporthe batatas TaxID=748121 RepID=UPI001D041634|nr:uncharacterized protein KVR01_005584 [Diaporthe batatas]KAG8165309.1 hypothetical protein KVR01_005584 [Diaporthe batatas]